MSQESMNQLTKFTAGLYDRITAATNQRKREAVLAIEMGLVQTTPIDTGAAISNWLVSRDSPRTDVIAPYAPSVKATHKHATLGDVAGASYNVQGAMEQAQSEVVQSIPGEPLFIANNVPYMEKLDGEGTSKQAQPGFVDRAIMAGVDVMNRAKLVL